MDSVSNSKLGNAINLSVDSRENTSSTAVNAREVASISRTFMGESSEARPDQQLRLDQREVKKSIQDPNHSIGDNCRPRSKSDPTPVVNRETDEVFTDEPTNKVNGSSKTVQKTDDSEEKVKDLFIKIDSIFNQAEFASFEELLSKFASLEELLNGVISSDMTDSYLINICNKVCEWIAPSSECFGIEAEVAMFSFAIAYNQISLVKLVLKLELNTKIEAFGSDERSLMPFAVLGGSPEMVKLLFSICIDAPQADHSWCPLLADLLECAVQLGKVEHVQSLLDLGADVNGMFTDKDGNHRWIKNPLASAVEYRDTKMVKCLLDFGKADPNGGIGSSPLSIAAAMNNIEHAELLLSRGADETPPDFFNSALAKSALNHENINTPLGLMIQTAKLRFENENTMDFDLLSEGNKDDPFRLRTFCFRTIETEAAFAQCHSIAERKVLAKKLKVPDGLLKPFYLGFNKYGATINGQNYSQAFYQH